MNKLLIFAGAAVILGYLLYKKGHFTPEEQAEIKHKFNKNKHHLTNAFSNAKKHLMNATSQ